jgi:hypothetical protein
VDTLPVSTPRLIVNLAAWKNPWKRQKIETLALLLKGALEAEAKVGLKMNIAEKNLAALLKSLPALRERGARQTRHPKPVRIRTGEAPLFCTSEWLFLQEFHSSLSSLIKTHPRMVMSRRAESVEADGIICPLRIAKIG